MKKSLFCVLFLCILYLGACSKKEDIFIQSQVNELSLMKDETYQLDIKTNDELGLSLTYDNKVMSVSDNFLVTAIEIGETKLIIKSKTNDSISIEIKVSVFDEKETIATSIPSRINMYNDYKVDAKIYPIDRNVNYTYEIRESNLASVSEDGVLTLNAPGVINLRIRVEDETLVLNKRIEIVKEFVVDKNNQDKLILNDIEFTKDKTLFSSLASALNKAQAGTTIVLNDGNYEDDLIVDKEDIILTGTSKAVVKSTLSVDANKVHIYRLNFVGNGFIYVNPDIEDILISENKFSNLSHDVEAAINILDAKNVTVELNEFEDINNYGIKLDGIYSGTNLIHKNKMNKVLNAMYFTADDTLANTELLITRNEIINANNVFINEIRADLALGYARFNIVEGFKEKAVKSSINNNFDYTLNYWGSAVIDQDDFENVDRKYTYANYQSIESIIDESKVNKNGPLYIEVKNPIESLRVRDSHKFELFHLPYELENPLFNVTSKDQELVSISNGSITGVKSGYATITIMSSANLLIKETIVLDVTTDPGILMTSDQKSLKLIKGDNVKLTATPYPHTLAKEEVFYTSSHPNVATVDEQGNVKSLQAGTVKITAKLKSDNFIQDEYFLTFHEALDENNLLDYLVMNSVSYVDAYTFRVNGVTSTYAFSTYESVSMFYFDEIEVNTTRMVPVSNGIRPGTKKPNPTDVDKGIFTFNKDHVYWIVIHDTANSDEFGGTAVNHANYLLNNALEGNVLNTSWHYTIDDYEMYQHIPEDEVAYHAADGQTLPGQSSQYAGGGNRNGIGIEMSVAYKDDLYRIYQRTAKFAAQKLVEYNLPRGHIKYHRDFSGKMCPNALINSGLMPYFEKFADIQYKVSSEFDDAKITFESHNKDILDNTGRIIKIPDYSTNVSYTISVELNGQTQSTTIQTYIPGSIR